jgi:hypothetical protein
MTRMTCVKTRLDDRLLPPPHGASLPDTGFRISLALPG